MNKLMAILLVMTCVIVPRIALARAVDINTPPPEKTPVAESDVRNKLDYINGYAAPTNVDYIFVQTRNHGELKLDWLQLDNSSLKEQDYIYKSLNSAVTGKTPLWLTFDDTTKTFTGSGIRTPYYDKLTGITDDNEGRIKVALMLCPSLFYITRNTPEFDESYKKLGDAKGKDVYLAAVPGGEIYDIIIK